MLPDLGDVWAFHFHPPVWLQRISVTCSGRPKRPAQRRSVVLTHRQARWPR
jgi:hypothetical protein